MNEFEVAKQLEAQSQNGNGVGDQGKFWPEPFSMQQFLSRPKDSTLYRWENTLAARGTSMIVALPRDGKTYLALNLGLSVARGVPFLGRKTVQSPVLYVSLDNSCEDMDQFVEKLGVTSSDQIFIQPSPIPDNAEEWLVDVIKRNGIKLAIIDTLQRFFQLEEGDYCEAVNRMTPLDNLAKDIGFHVLYVHHAGKNGVYLGTTAYKAMCPTFMELMRVGELQQRVLKSDQRTGTNFDSVAVAMNKHGWLEVAGTYEDVQVREITVKIHELLEAHEGDGQTESYIRKEMPARGIIVSKAIKGMHKAGEIERTGGGKKGDPFKYHLAKTLSAEGPSYSFPFEGEKKTGLAGQESKNMTQVQVNSKKNSSPEFWDKNGTSTDEQNSARELRDEQNDGWEILE